MSLPPEAKLWLFRRDGAMQMIGVIEFTLEQPYGNGTGYGTVSHIRSLGW
jgi:hypothetical protein